MGQKLCLIVFILIRDKSAIVLAAEMADFCEFDPVCIMTGCETESGLRCHQRLPLTSSPTVMADQERETEPLLPVLQTDELPPVYNIIHQIRQVGGYH